MSEVDRLRGEFIIASIALINTLTYGEMARIPQDSIVLKNAFQAMENYVAAIERANLVT